MSLSLLNALKTPNKKIIVPLFFVAYCAFIAVSILHHEPWRDETHAWMIARDMDYVSLLSNLIIEGAMPLWHTLLYILTRLNLPFESIYILNYLFITTAAFLLLYKSPFPKLVSICVILSSAFLYDFSVVARHYALSTCLLFTILTVFPQRHIYNYRYVALLLLLFLSNVFAIFVSFILFAEFCLKKKIGFKYLALGATLLVCIIAVYAYPRILEEWAQINEGCCGIFSIFNNGAWNEKLWSGLFSLYVVITTLYLMIYFPKNRTGKLVIVLFSVNFFWFFYVCYIGYFCSFYRTLNLYIYLIVGIWLLSQNIKLTKEHKMFLLGIAIIASLNSFHMAVQSQIYDLNHPFSASTEMSEYITNNIADDHIIGTGDIVITSVTLAYLKNRQLYYIPKNDFRTHYDYRTDDYNYHLRNKYRESFNQFLAKFANEHKPVYFLSGYDLAQWKKSKTRNKNNKYMMKHLDLVHKEKGKKEKLFLYKVKN